MEVVKNTEILCGSAKGVQQREVNCRFSLRASQLRLLSRHFSFPAFAEEEEDPQGPHDCSSEVVGVLPEPSTSKPSPGG